ncbi:MAG TPA: 50S ribosomal protein L25, partial [Vicinamibacteria bacterium]|nr:50S ribosomal protein L25 [Vicinamibacteria bacterium]
MPDVVVTARRRDQSGKNANRRLRSDGQIPGILYGTRKEAVPVAVSPKEIGTILRSATGENTLFDLDLDGSRRKVLIKEFQVEPIKGRLLHADFYEVALDKPLQISVHVELHGVPVGVKVQGGIMDFVTRELEIECLPADIPQKIEVDVSNLELGKHLRVSDLKVSDKITILDEPELVIAHVVAPRAEEAPAAAEAAA